MAFQGIPLTTLYSAVTGKKGGAGLGKNKSPKENKWFYIITGIMFIVFWIAALCGNEWISAIIGCAFFAIFMGLLVGINL